MTDSFSVNHQQLRMEPKFRDLRLLQRALHYVHVGADALLYDKERLDDPHEFAVIYLAIGAELLLKQPLMDQHWSLVFAKPEDATLTKFKSGDFFSVPFTQLFKRLDGVCQVQLTEYQAKALNSLAARRNALVHFGHTDGSESLLATASSGIGVILELIKLLCPTETLEPEMRKQIQQIRNTAGGVLAVVESRWQVIKDEWMSSKAAIYRCPECHFNAAQIMVNKVRCLFCLYSASDSQATIGENLEMPPESCFPTHLVRVSKCKSCNGPHLEITYKDSANVILGITQLCFACTAYSEKWEVGAVARDIHKSMPLRRGRMQIEGDERWSREIQKVTLTGGPRDGDIEWAESDSERIVCWIGAKDAHYKRKNAHIFEFDGWQEPETFREKSF
jgi:hypothetical protein